ncbi:C-type mannose receptor 2-like isoform 2-T2 [Menidia menidia]
MENAALVLWASALSGFLLPTEGQFHVIYEEKSWQDARAYCQEKFSDLVTVDSLETVHLLYTLLDPAQMNQVTHKYRTWIGLVRDQGSWAWSGGGATFGETSFQNWGPGKPGSGSPSCVSVYDTGTWADGNCNDYLRPVCYDPEGEPRFTVNSDHKTWWEAQDFCRQNHSDLAVVSDQSENSKLSGLVTPGTNVWIGLHRGRSSELWRTTNGSEDTLSYWSEGEPNSLEEKCAVANYENQGKWEDWQCETTVSFICYGETPLEQVLAVRLDFGSLDPADPVGLEELLNQIQQRLRDGGAPALRIRWRRHPDGLVLHRDPEPRSAPEEPPIQFNLFL